jgi:hypothetical protein
MQIASRLGHAELSYADAVVTVAAVDAVSHVQAAANDASALPFPAEAICMRDSYFTFELV